ncbi:hypothetical protein BGX38DRAFT_1143988 [Terfezia claveryi]|nr:hypothetical protein BGX38DRAFT_1143988 [Terfezia claveryi]
MTIKYIRSLNAFSPAARNFFGEYSTTRSIFAFGFLIKNGEILVELFNSQIYWKQVTTVKDILNFSTTCYRLQLSVLEPTPNDALWEMQGLNSREMGKYYSKKHSLEDVVAKQPYMIDPDRQYALLYQHGKLAGGTFKYPELGMYLSHQREVNYYFKNIRTTHCSNHDY